MIGSIWPESEAGDSVKPIMWGVVGLAMVSTAAGCGSLTAQGPRAVPPAVISYHSSIKSVGTAWPSAAARWSPSGRQFAFSVNPQTGTAIVGLTASLRTRPEQLGPGRHIVALTARYAIVASASDRRDWLYPLIGNRLGNPVAWNAPTDTWQSWVQTRQGPAIVTGGYHSQKAALTESTGDRIPLSGSQVFVSPDGKYGAVTGGTRLSRNVASPGAFAPSRYQPSPVTTPITVWNFDAITPRPMVTIHLPAVYLPKAAGGALVGYLEFSPNEQYLSVLVQGNNGVGPKLVGKTFIYEVSSGELVGIAPYGNGMMWALDSQGLWLGTPLPQGQGRDRLVNIHGATLWTWPDGRSQGVVTPVSGQALVVVHRGHLAVWNKNRGFTSLAHLRTYPPNTAVQAPGGAGILMNVGGEMLYWGAKS